MAGNCFPYKPPVAIVCPACGGAAYHFQYCPTLAPRKREVWVNVCPTFFDKPGDAFCAWAYPTKEMAIVMATAPKALPVVSRYRIVFVEGVFDE